VWSKIILFSHTSASTPEILVLAKLLNEIKKNYFLAVEAEFCGFSLVGNEVEIR